MHTDIILQLKYTIPDTSGTHSTEKSHAYNHLLSNFLTYFCFHYNFFIHTAQTITLPAHWVGDRQGWKQTQELRRLLF